MLHQKNFFIEHYIKETVSTESKLELSTSKIQKSKEKYTFDKNFKHVCFGFSASGPTKRWDIEKYIHITNIVLKLNLDIPSD